MRRLAEQRTYLATTTDTDTVDTATGTAPSPSPLARETSPLGFVVGGCASPEDASLSLVWLDEIGREWGEKLQWLARGTVGCCGP